MPDEIAPRLAALNFTAPPDIRAGRSGIRPLPRVSESTGADVLALPADRDTTLDSIYVRDASLVTPHGIVLCRMGKPQRGYRACRATQRVRIVGAAGRRNHHAAWHHRGRRRCVARRTHGRVGRGYRTNDEGIAQFRALLGESR